MRRLLILLSILFLSACKAPDQPLRVDFNSLVAAPEKYTGKRIEIEGVYAMGFESMLFEAPDGPSPIRIWFDFVRTAELNKKESGFELFKSALDSAPNKGAWNTERILKVKVIGRFEYSKDGGYGHIGGCLAELTVEKVLEATPCPKEPDKRNVSAH